ncbi:MAG: hypothetical protein DWQ34_18625 [Planctomycetota bacterium]|nr:MAG: hypothetical protein DWQ29_11585 [Planctomycetota bacterium]REJ89758.1 MAG: hypothetical protein DWQ34_18625 [Planctomycetota bacterium]REK26418.1 MAG: hypothetical protein DWQ41_09970 [Planctomycetota bacterium]REK32051.1 MAG: hypothetical protein DWQ45_17960 [Planctomycetota bacterium]
MIVELELLEQILDDEWPISRAVAFVNSLGKPGWTVLRRHWEAGNIEFLTVEGVRLQDWQIQELVRQKDDSYSSVQVRCSDRGAKLL